MENYKNIPTCRKYLFLLIQTLPAFSTKWMSILTTLCFSFRFSSIFALQFSGSGNLDAAAGAAGTGAVGHNTDPLIPSVYRLSTGHSPAGRGKRGVLAARTVGFNRRGRGGRCRGAGLFRFRTVEDMRC